jgi:hypothetical protein
MKNEVGLNQVSCFTLKNKLGPKEKDPEIK